MHWLYIPLTLLLFYFFLIFTIAPRVVPFMRKKPIGRVPREVDEVVKRLERRSKTPHDYIRECADHILSDKHCARIKAFFIFPRALERNLSVLFKRRGFLHCNHLNQLMRVMLARSKFFSDDDIRIRTVFLNFFVHQYLQVRVAGQWYDVDLGADHFGIPLGKHAWGFR